MKVGILIVLVAVGYLDAQGLQNVHPPLGNPANPNEYFDRVILGVRSYLSSLNDHVMVPKFGVRDHLTFRFMYQPVTLAYTLANATLQGLGGMERIGPVLYDHNRRPGRPIMTAPLIIPNYVITTKALLQSWRFRFYMVVKVQVPNVLAEIDIVNRSSSGLPPISSRFSITMMGKPTPTIVSLGPVWGPMASYGVSAFMDMMEDQIKGIVTFSTLSVLNAALNVAGVI